MKYRMMLARHEEGTVDSIDFLPTLQSSRDHLHCEKSIWGKHGDQTMMPFVCMLCIRILPA